jgi:hypothetical protein
MAQKPYDAARESLTEQIEAKEKDLRAVTRALTLPVTAVDEVRLKEQSDALIGEIQALEEQLRRLGNSATDHVWNVPHRRNPNFTGRDDLLARLRAALVSGRPAAVTQAVAGLGGVGKTQIATEYCYRHRGEYETVWWLRSEEPSTLADDYVSLGIKAGIVAPDERDQAASAAKVREWLEQTTGWLLVFDNANNPGEIADYLPRTESGHVVVTTRHQAWGGVAEALAVQSWPEDEAAVFLCKRTKSTDDAAARAIAQFLGGLPRIGKNWRPAASRSWRSPASPTPTTPPSRPPGSSRSSRRARRGARNRFSKSAPTSPLTTSRATC